MRGAQKWYCEDGRNIGAVTQEEGAAAYRIRENSKM